MNGFFGNMLQIAISAGVLIALVVVLRLVLIKAGASRGAILILWIAVAIRLILPISFASALGVLPDLRPEDSVVNTVDDNTEPVTAVPADYSDDAYASASWGGPAAFHWQSPALLLYGAGVLALVLYYIASTHKLSKAVRGAIPVDDQIWLSDTFDTAFIFGIASPRIIIPDALDELVREVVIRHELSHLAHKDHLWKPLAFFLLALHWYNPFVWLAYILFVRDLEFACDERVTADMSVGERKGYSLALLTLGNDTRPSITNAVAFGEGNVKTRIKAVCRRRRSSVILTVVAVLLTLMLCVYSLIYRVSAASDGRSISNSDTSHRNSSEETRVRNYPDYMNETMARPIEPMYDVTETPVPDYDVTETPAP